jgi:hypothetical protein
MGNTLKKGRDYGETFSSTISGDGLRWFFALAVTCGKEIKGWDATTGYLQSEQRVPIYAYLPSHHGFAELLGTLRLHLTTVLKEQGMQGIKELSKQMKRDRRDRPKTVLKLNKKVYGIPDAGQAFSMFIQGLHKQKCGLMQSEMDLCIFYKIVKDDLVKDFLVVITWVDDCRYFGTTTLVNEYEKVLMENCKCTLEGGRSLSLFKFSMTSTERYWNRRRKIIESRQWSGSRTSYLKTGLNHVLSHYRRLTKSFSWSLARRKRMKQVTYRTLICKGSVSIPLPTLDWKCAIGRPISSGSL